MKKIISFITIVVLILNIFVVVAFAENNGVKLYFYDISTGEEVVFEDNSETFDESMEKWFEISKGTFNYLSKEVFIKDIQSKKDVLYIDFNDDFLKTDSHSIDVLYFLRSLKKTIFMNSDYSKIMFSINGEQLDNFGELDFSEGLIKTDKIVMQAENEPELRIPVVPDPVIVIDPGHGGIFSGAVYNGLSEKTINLDIGLYLRNYLENKGATVIMTRTTDTQLDTNIADDLSARADVANNNNADFFVSLHANAYTDDSSVNGVETYYPDTHDSISSKYLAEDLNNSLSSRHSLDNRGEDTKNFAVLRETTMPAVLNEVGFMSNPSDFSLMDTTSERQALAYSIYLGIRNYWYGY